MSGLNAFQLLNGLTFAALLFIVASGFTLIFGLLRIVNLAHGALYLLGGYLGYAAASATGSFLVGVLAAMAGVAVCGLILDRGLLRFVRGYELRQVLLTLGVAFVLNDMTLVIFGGDTYTVPTPDFLKGAVRFWGLFYPKYRLFVLALGVVVFIALWVLLNKTRLGALIRAGVDDPEIIAAMGINIRKVFLLTFMLGAALAGLGGAVGGAFLTLYPSADSEILVFSLAVVIIGGRGSLVGAAVGALIVGMLNTIGQVMFPEFAYFVIFGPMAAILAFRPLGLFGKAA
ncbi:branched-chain amino acid ABC transporter permease [Azorhizobium oxalatiphilum]|uniref:Branched-chain amino acid ABC transporter permease n=1 Tax=Azorhizobium oxalatiphilum TaxID=980631 RepID=A0A917BLN7_9HYPH|nr:branched-chain amino acid ABC transporter permease [Azorhizobium oxalatiphilum]GGF48398.1 branched-chain amino acid ABC transporter permease [Azorhizobium oxalatiphilum]